MPSGSQIVTLEAAYGGMELGWLAEGPSWAESCSGESTRAMEDLMAGLLLKGGLRAIPTRKSIRCLCHKPQVS